MVSNWVWEKDLSFFEYHSLVQKNEWRVVMNCEYIDLDVISQLLCVWMVLLGADDPKYVLLPHLLGHISPLLFAVCVLIPVCGSCSSGLPQTIIQTSSSEQISLVKSILVWEVYKLLNFEAPWETPEHLGPLSFWCVFDCIIPICLASEAIRILDMPTAVFRGLEQKMKTHGMVTPFTWWEDLIPVPVYSPVDSMEKESDLALATFNNVARNPVGHNPRLTPSFFLLLRAAVPSCCHFLWHGHLTSKMSLEVLHGPRYFLKGSSIWPPKC